MINTAVDKIKHLYTVTWYRRILFGILGAGIGYTYYYYIGCASGSCPITGNPYISTGYGLTAGLLLVPGEKAKAKLKNENGNSKEE
jgi:hypothetical protein